MKGVYTSAAKIAGLNSTRTLAYLTAPVNKVVEIIGVTVTDESVATNFQMEIAIANISSLGTPTATQVTPTPHEKGDQAAGSSTFFNVTANEPTYGSTVTQEGAAAVQGYRHEPYPDERIYVAPGQSIGIRLQTTPTAFDADVRLTWREVG
jgi:hypothetical protein